MNKIIKWILIIFTGTFGIGFLVSYAFILSKFQTIDPKTVNYIRSTYHDSTIQYFSEIAFGSESGSNNDILAKWEKDTIFYTIKDSATAEDVRFTIKVLNVIDSIIPQHLIQLSETEREPDLTIHFIRYQDAVEQYNYNTAIVAEGFFLISTGKNDCITKATAVIFNNYENRHPVIIEEITQSFGLAKDSYIYKNSVFHQNGHDSVFAKIDLQLLDILYNSGLKTGLSQKTYDEAMDLDYEKVLNEQFKKKSLFEMN